MRSPACTTLKLRRSPSATSWVLRPSALVVLGKSNAMRGGLLTVNPAGGLAGACFSVTRTTTLPPVAGETLIDSMLFAWA